jgi:hypothetical protein
MERQNVNMLTNMHHPPAEGNFCNEHGNDLKPAIVQGCNRHMGHADKSDHIMKHLLHQQMDVEVYKKSYFFPSPGPFNTE